ncbi:MAG: hypothetical protein OHK0011_00810 [Turneriella sp.]
MRTLIPEWSADIRHRMVIPRRIHPAIRQSLKQLAAFLAQHIDLDIISSRQASIGLPENTAIWLRDYHPLPVSHGESGENGHIAFTYSPAYGPRLGAHAVLEVQQRLTPHAFVSELVIEGGNLVHNGRGDIVMTTRVLADNALTDKEFAAKLSEVIFVRHLILLPEEPGDITGHIDAAVRFITPHVVALNDYPGMPPVWRRWFDAVYGRLKTQFEIIQVNSEPPLEIYGERFPSVYGNRLNWIRHTDTVLFPSFGLAEDRRLPKTLAEFGLNAVPVPQDKFALLTHFGGSLHCLTAECLR